MKKHNRNGYKLVDNISSYLFLSKNYKDIKKVKTLYPDATRIIPITKKEIRQGIWRENPF